MECVHRLPVLAPVVTVLVTVSVPHEACAQAALQFDGLDDRVEVGAFARTFEAFTIEAWVRKSRPTDFYFDTIVSTDAFRFQIERDNRIEFWARGDSEHFGPQILVDGTWQHVAVVWNGGNVMLYHNGDGLPSPSPGGQLLTTATVRLGHDGLSGLGADDAFDGTLDEIRFWDHARTPEQLTRFMHATRLEGSSGLVAYWSFDEGSGQTTVDGSGSGANGELGDSPLADAMDPQWTTTEDRSFLDVSSRCGYVPHTVHFEVTAGSIDDSLTNPRWEFGDGSVGDGLSASYTYLTAGSHPVRFSGRTEDGVELVFEAGAVQVLQAPPVAAFTLTRDRDAAPPLEVTFTDLSTGEVNERAWDFGDGSRSSARDPVHVFESDGVYEISLRVTGTCPADERNESISTMTLEIGVFLRGDTDADGELSISDPVRTLSHLFLVRSDGYLDCLDAADTDDDGEIELSDAIGVLNHLFLGGLPPAPPVRVAGPDPTLDGLSCLRP